jgi:catechol 2,3-dioxygenase-like lactoylglutathione lyase family enzyme
MFSYACLGTNDLQRATCFYDAVLATLGLNRCVSGDADWDRSWSGWGTYNSGSVTEASLWVGKPFNEEAATSGNGTMLALRTRSSKEVDDFHAAALANGGSSEGAPGLRPHYGPDFYVAYVRDPDGNKIAAVFTHFGDLQPFP